MFVSVTNFVCKGDNYYWSDTYHYIHGIGYFYNVNLLKTLDVLTEIDHELVWLDAYDCCEKLFHEHQSWAVEQAVLQRA